MRTYTPGIKGRNVGTSSPYSFATYHNYIFKVFTFYLTVHYSQYSFKNVDSTEIELGAIRCSEFWKH